MDKLTQLREDLWSRWRQQAERLPLALEDAALAAKKLYAIKRIFDLKNYAPRKFAAAGRSSSKPFPGLDNYEYVVDGRGRPVRTAFTHSHNRVDWRGLYAYGADTAEYSEWCLQTGVCSQYDRVGLAGEQQATFQRLTVNSAGSAPAWKGSSRSVMNAISSDPRNYSIWIEAYDHSEGRIVSGVKYTEGLGSPPLRSTLTYLYSDGRLDRILQRWETGEEQTIFAARRATSLTSLTADLSRRIADRIIELVREARLPTPIELLELSYVSLESVVPMIIPRVEGDRSNPPLVAEVDPSRWMSMRDEEFAPDIADFRQRIASTERYVSAARMLREAARQVTERGPAQFRAAEHFVAYAIDWEAEGDELERILRECGASAGSLEAFKIRGWL